MDDNDNKKKCNDSTQEGTVEDMLANAVESNSLSDFIKMNKAKLYEAARNNTKYNADGKAIISKDDDWKLETEWEEQYKKGNKST